MLVYWAMFALPALSSIIQGARRTLLSNRSSIGLLLMLLLFTVLIGLRFEVGGDWGNYERTMNRIRFMSFSGVLDYKDPGFGVLAWLSIHLGWDVYGANIFCGFVLMYGLVKFARRLPDPWLAVTAAVPYLIIVVGMGYVRQAAAIGFVLLAIIELERRAYYRFMGWMGAAALFHASALAILPLTALVTVRQRKVLLIPLTIVSIVFYVFVLQDRLETVSSYSEEGLDSEGALVRLAMNAAPAALFLLMRKRFDIDDHVRSIWSVFSMFAIFMLLVLQFFPSTTIVDRIGLYFIPIQIFVFGHLPILVTSSWAGSRMISYLVVLYYGSVLYIWLNQASHARLWLPYQFLPLV